MMSPHFNLMIDNNTNGNEITMTYDEVEEEEDNSP